MSDFVILDPNSDEARSAIAFMAEAISGEAFERYPHSYSQRRFFIEGAAWAYGVPLDKFDANGRAIRPSTLTIESASGALSGLVASEGETKPHE